MAVYYKKADAGGAGESGFKVQGLDEKMDVSEMTILATSDPLPHLPWAIKRGLGGDMAQRAQAALLKLNTNPRGADILKRAQLTALRPAADADYDVCRKMIGAVAGGK
jgi:phosphonate transport system substrate-binding protein